MPLFQILNYYRKSGTTTPSGTLTTGDYLTAFYDTDTKTIKVYKNGVNITTGDNIVIPSPGSLAANEIVYQVGVCEGGDRLKFVRQTTFPYFRIEYLYDHPSCSLTPVCDLRFNTIADVTDATSLTASDGSIIVSAVSSNTGIQYKLNEDFVYGSGQTSGTFNNLKAGLYVVYARDSSNCRSVQSVKVNVAHSYGVKYRLEYINRTGDTHKTEILEKDYTGSVNLVEGNLTPTTYRLRNEGQNEKFIIINPSEIETSFISITDGQFDDIYTSDPKKYRLRHIINGNIVWIGNVLINQYSENYVNPPYPVNIIASDGLASLIDIPFLDDNNLQFNGIYKQIEIIAFILRKTGLNLNIRSAINMYASSMAKTNSDDPLDQAYVDISRYYLVESNPTCAQVLQWILEPYTASIIQWNNAWYIFRLEERIDAFDYRQFDYNGNYVNNSSYNPVINLENASNTDRMVWANQNQRLRIMPGYGSIRLINDLGNKFNIIDNGDFRLRSKYVYDFFAPSTESVPDLSGFEIVNITLNSGTFVDYEKIEDNNIAVILDSWLSLGDNYLLTKTYNLKLGNIDKIKIKYKYKINRSYWKSDVNFGFMPFYVKVKMMVRYGDYYLKADGKWTTSPSFIINYVNQDQFGKFIDYELIAQTPDFTYINGKNFYIRLYLPDVNEAEFKSSTTSAAIELLKDVSTVNLPEGERTEIYDIDGTYTAPRYASGLLFYELKEDTNDEVFPNIIRPDDYNVSTNPVQWVLQMDQNYNTDIVTSLSVDYIKAEILSENSSLPDNEVLEKSMENDNETPVGKTIVHSSLVNNGRTLLRQFKISTVLTTGLEITLSNNNGFKITNAQWFDIYTFSANSADIVYSGYLRDSAGVGYDKWELSDYAISKTIQDIYLDTYAVQYNKPWRFLIGDMYSDDKFFSPIDTLKETIDNDRLYIPLSLEIDFNANLYRVEMAEIFDINENSPAGFTKGFTIGFNA